MRIDKSLWIPHPPNRWCVSNRLMLQIWYSLHYFKTFFCNKRNQFCPCSTFRVNNNVKLVDPNHRLYPNHSLNHAARLRVNKNRNVLFFIRYVQESDTLRSRFIFYVPLMWEDESLYFLVDGKWENTKDSPCLSAPIIKWSSINVVFPVFSLFKIDHWSKCTCLIS